ncbi:MAG: hybrid sensor histidine kinase/response regulator [Burkholderiaceae bacterium]|nr:hybrid sensor histidine kinase/response regulator [Burkholderiaceae bacterium]
MNVLRPPKRFQDPELEGDFLLGYRRSGLRFAKIAFTVAAAMALAFWVLLPLFPIESQASAARQHVRLALALLLMSAAGYLHFRPERTIRAFEWSVGVPMGVGCLAVGALGFVPLDSGDFAVNRIAVATTLACWLCYGFSRLPAIIVAAACIPASILTMSGVNLQGDDHVIVLGVYLIVANFIGWILSVEIERRERSLFWGARQLAEARVRSEAMAHEAFEANAEKTRVLAAVSHDLRQPLASLTLYAQLLREHQDGFDAGARQPLDSIEACIGALSSDLDRLTELGLRERGTPHPVEGVDLSSVLERIERVHSGLARRAGVRLVVRVPPAGECRVVSNESRLWDIFANLVGNALKFTATGHPAWVLVRVRALGSGLEVVVRDNGIGIDLPDQRRVFDEYFQVSNPSRSAKQGHGLGLSIVRETVSRLPGHSIRLSSSLGKGTAFVLHLPGSRRPLGRPTAGPLARRMAATGAVSRVAPAFVSYPLPVESVLPVDGGRVSDVVAASHPQRASNAWPASFDGGVLQSDALALVLVIEDDEAMGEALRRTFERWGFEVESAQSGEDAIALVSAMQRAFDAIVSDFRLPGAWDGLRLIEELRRLEGVRTPAILLSGEFRVEALLCDAPDDVHVMAKPPDVGRLRELLRRFARARAPVGAA